MTDRGIYCGRCPHKILSSKNKEYYCKKYHETLDFIEKIKEVKRCDYCIDVEGYVINGILIREP